VKRAVGFFVNLFIAIFFVAGCALQQRAEGQNATEAMVWNGRLSMQVDRAADQPGAQPQSFSAGFALSGTPASGELRLLTPLGSTVAQVQWRDQGATMQSGGQTRQYPSLDELTLDLLGASVPSEAWFAWLQGQDLALPGWQLDLSQYAQGKVQAQRLWPLPQARLRLVLEH
jgi:outer membrane lipoprotein LolB